MITLNNEPEIEILIHGCDAQMQINWHEYEANYRISSDQSIQGLPHARATVKQLTGVAWVVVTSTAQTEP